MNVAFDGKDATIGCKDKAGLARGLLAMKSGSGAFSLEETRSMNTFGAMLDLSRNRVLRVSAIQRYMDNLAVLSFNAVMLYMEDAYEMEKYGKLD